jgi:hypothetical protein
VAFMDEGLNSERRKYPRFNIDLPLKYNGGTRLFPKNGRAINASEGGLLVHLQEEIVVGHRLALKLFLQSHSELNIISPSVQVVWTGIHMRKDFTWDYPTGVRFVDIPPKDMIKYKNFLMDFTQKPSDTT